MNNNFRALFSNKKFRWVMLPTATVFIIVIISAIMALSTSNTNIREADAFVPIDPPPIVEPMEEEEPEPEEEVEEEPEDTTPRAMLTGLPIEEAYVNRRPIAVVINNLHRALPQSGVTSADIIYEVLAEGEVTRLVAIFQSEIPEKIGPVRSTRDYFVDFAFNHDAIFVHHGGSPTGYSRVRDSGVAAMDGMNLEGSVFWRDRTYPSWHWNSGTRPLEHSSYTSRERMERHIDSREIRYEIGDNPAFGFTFADTIPIPATDFAARVVVPFSAGYGRTFTFDPETRLYLVSNRHGAHDDAETREQAAVANILIQLTEKRVIDNAGRRSVTTIGEGTGYFITDGLVRPVTWVRESLTSPMRWYFENGEPLVMQPGRTWINVLQSNATVVFE